MRNRFREWYAPTSDELKRLWEAGTIVLDSNVLLGLYHYPPSTLDEFLKVLDRVKDRLWLPHEAGLELHRNRDKSLPQQRTVLERLINSIEDLTSHLESLGLPEYHPVLDLPAVEAGRLKVKDAFESLLQEIRSALQRTPAFDPKAILHGDPVRERLTELFAGRVGVPFTPAVLDQIHKDGAKRYAAEVPPGYKDRAKGEPSCYGDLVVWQQLLRDRKAATAKFKGTILVTNDRKEDWWLRRGDLIVGPRPELVREYLDQVGGDFYMYTPADFLRDAPQYLKLTVSTAAIEDVGRISTLSPVAEILRAQRMVLPEPAARARALARVHDAFSSGKVPFAGDLNNVIQSLGAPFDSSYVATPLFFSLVNESYGPIRVDQDITRKLRDRRVQLSPAAATRESFMQHAHAAWLAQALFRVRLEGFSDEDLLVALWGGDYPSDAGALLEQAKQLVQSDILYRGK